jgi:exoribonuclease II
MHIHSEFSAYTTGQSTYMQTTSTWILQKKMIAESGQEREQLIIGEVINFRVNHKLAFYERTQLSFTPSQIERLFESALQC